MSVCDGETMTLATYASRQELPVTVFGGTTSRKRRIRIAAKDPCIRAMNCWRQRQGSDQFVSFLRPSNWHTPRSRYENTNAVITITSSWRRLQYWRSFLGINNSEHLEASSFRKSYYTQYI